MRGSLKEYFMKIAIQTATRATCDRLHTGAIFVRDKMVLTGGYNGAPRGLLHCTDENVGCLMIDGHCKRTVHSEANAVAQAARTGINIKGAEAFVTHLPCYDCFKLLINAGIIKIYYNKSYDNKTNELLFITADEIDFPIEQVKLTEAINKEKKERLEELIFIIKELKIQEPPEVTKIAEELRKTNPELQNPTEMAWGKFYYDAVMKLMTKLERKA